MAPLDPQPTPDSTVSVVKKSWLPTRKWIAAEITAGIGLATALLTGDRALTDPEIILLITFVGQALVSYVYPNKDENAIGGVPVKGAGV